MKTAQEFKTEAWRLKHVSPEYARVGLSSLIKKIGWAVWKMDKKMQDSYIADTEASRHKKVDPGRSPATGKFRARVAEIISDDALLADMVPETALRVKLNQESLAAIGMRVLQSAPSQSSKDSPAKRATVEAVMNAEIGTGMKKKVIKHVLKAAPHRWVDSRKRCGRKRNNFKLSPGDLITGLKDADVIRYSSEPCLSTGKIFYVWAGNMKRCFANAPRVQMHCF